MKNFMKFYLKQTILTAVLIGGLILSLFFIIFYHQQKALAALSLVETKGGHDTVEYDSEDTQQYQTIVKGGQTYKYLFLGSSGNLSDTFSFNIDEDSEYVLEVVGANVRDNLLGLSDSIISKIDACDTSHAVTRDFIENLQIGVTDSGTPIGDVNIPATYHLNKLNSVKLNLGTLTAGSVHNFQFQLKNDMWVNYFQEGTNPPVITCPGLTIDEFNNLYERNFSVKNYLDHDLALYEVSLYKVTDQEILSQGGDSLLKEYLFPVKSNQKVEGTQILKRADEFLLDDSDQNDENKIYQANVEGQSAPVYTFINSGNGPVYEFDVVDSGNYLFEIEIANFYHDLSKVSAEVKRKIFGNSSYNTNISLDAFLKKDGESEFIKVGVNLEAPATFIEKQKQIIDFDLGFLPAGAHQFYFESTREIGQSIIGYNLTQEEIDFINQEVALSGSQNYLSLDPAVISASLYQTEPKSDVIGLRIYSNFNKLDPFTWYQSNVPNPGKNPTQEVIAGYEAVRDGRTVYINAANVDPGSYSFYTNIFVFSYNQNASAGTISVFNELLENWNFNINIDDRFKNQIINDTKRIADIQAIKDMLERYKAISGSYPKIETGSYIKNYTTSVWPSWQSALGNALGQTLPVDPLNGFINNQLNIANNQPSLTPRQINCNDFNDSLVLGFTQNCGQEDGPQTICSRDENENPLYACGTKIGGTYQEQQCYNNGCSICPPGYDSQTCWNDETLKYYFETQPNAKLADGTYNIDNTFVYQYSVSADGQSYTLSYTPEYNPDAGICSIDQCYFDNFDGNNTNDCYPSGTCLLNETGNQAHVNRRCYLGRWVNSCGDGIIQDQCGEVCEVGEAKSFCDLNYGQQDWYNEAAVINQCTNQCQWSLEEDSLPAATGPVTELNCGGYCGNGMVEAQYGEQCDQGAAGGNSSQTDAGSSSGSQYMCSGSYLVDVAGQALNPVDFVELSQQVIGDENISEDFQEDFESDDILKNQILYANSQINSDVLNKINQLDLYTWYPLEQDDNQCQMNALENGVFISTEFSSAGEKSLKLRKGSDILCQEDEVGAAMLMPVIDSPMVFAADLKSTEAFAASMVYFIDSNYNLISPFQFNTNNTDLRTFKKAFSDRLSPSNPVYALVIYEIVTDSLKTAYMDNLQIANWPGGNFNSSFIINAIDSYNAVYQEQSEIVEQYGPCKTYGGYCGDGILQNEYGEMCDPASYSRPNSDTMQNILTNPSFEDGFENWQLNDSNQGSIAFGDATQGEYALKVGDDDLIITQNKKIIDGEYILKIKYKLIRGDWQWDGYDGASDINLTQPEPDVWNSSSQQIILGSRNDISFSFDGHGELLIDSLELIPQSYKVQYACGTVETPVAWWKFNNTSDSVYNSYNVINPQDLVYSDDSILDKSANLAGRNIEIDDNNRLDIGNSSYTVSFWAKDDVYSNASMLISNSSAYAGCDIAEREGLEIRQYDNRYNFRICNADEGGKNAAIDSALFNTIDNQWHNIMAIYDKPAKKMKMIIDGTQKTEINNVDLGVSIDSVENFTIGSRFNGQFKYNGLIDEVAVWKYALTDYEVEQYYQNYKGGYLNVGSNFCAMRGGYCGDGVVQTQYGEVCEPDSPNENDPYTAVKNLVGYWKLENNPSDKYNAHTSTITGNLESITGQVGKAYQFDGESYISAQRTSGNYQIPSGETNQELSLEFWLNWASTARDDTTYMVAGIYNAWRIEIENGGELWIRTWGSDESQNNNGGTINKINKGQWYHIVATWRVGQGHMVFVNGRLWDSRDPVNTDTSSFNALQQLTIGGVYNYVDNAVYGNLFAGALDEVAIYNKILETEEINVHYQNGLANYGYGCTYQCQQPICGDGLVQEFLGEVCDPQDPNEGAYCQSDCSGFKLGKICDPNNSDCAAGYVCAKHTSAAPEYTCIGQRGAECTNDEGCMYGYTCHQFEKVCVPDTDIFLEYHLQDPVDPVHPEECPKMESMGNGYTMDKCTGLIWREYDYTGTNVTNWITANTSACSTLERLPTVRELMTLVPNINKAYEKTVKELNMCGINCEYSPNQECVFGSVACLNEGNTGTPPDCGNGSCSDGETCSTCPADCGLCNDFPYWTSESFELANPACSVCLTNCEQCPSECGFCDENYRLKDEKYYAINFRLGSVEIYNSDTELKVRCIKERQCGNGIIEAGEECEFNPSSDPAEEILSQTCQQAGYDQGEMHCKPSDCSFDESKCLLYSRPNQTCEQVCADRKSLNCKSINGALDLIEPNKYYNTACNLTAGDCTHIFGGSNESQFCEGRLAEWAYCQCKESE